MNTLNNFLFRPSYLNSNFPLSLGYLNPALKNQARLFLRYGSVNYTGKGRLPGDHLAVMMMMIGSLRCGRFRGDGDVTAQVDWARGCRSRAKINLLKILMTASETSSSTSAVLSQIQSLLFVTWPHLKIFDNFSFFTTTLI